MQHERQTWQSYSTKTNSFQIHRQLVPAGISKDTVRDLVWFFFFGKLTHYKEPTIVSNQVEVINERMFGELSLFPTKGSTAILKGMNFGITQSGTAVPGTSIKIILYHER